MSGNRIDSISSSLVRQNTRVTEGPQTQNSAFGARMKDGLATAANTVASGIGVAAPLVPGGAIISAAVSGAVQMGGRSGAATRGAYGMGPGTVAVPTASSSSAPVLSGGSSGSTSVAGTLAGTGSSGGIDANTAMLQQMQDNNQQFLMLQNNMQQENQKFSTLSNVLKTRHETAKNSISNIR